MEILYAGPTEYHSTYLQGAAQHGSFDLCSRMLGGWGVGGG